MFRTIIAACVVAGSLQVGRGQEPQEEIPEREALRALIFFAVEDPESSVRVAALNSLARARQVEEGLDKALLRGVRDADTNVRRAAVQALASIDLDARLAVPALIEAANDPDTNVSRTATSRLAKYGAAAVPYLREAVKQPNTRLGALHALGSLGANGKAGLSAVTEAMKDPDPIVRVAAATALGKLLTRPNSGTSPSPFTIPGVPAVPSAAPVRR
jgi:HEAT repeat protein